VNPFAALGLPAAADLTDERVRAAWRQTAARTHPDRDDGGDPAAYTAAATAYAQLRTPWGRSEALADLAAPEAHGPAAKRADAAPATAALRWLKILPARVRHGRPLRLAARTVTAAAAVALLALAVITGTPSAPAIIAGCVLWLAFTAPADLAPPPGR
jgi:curved DNA-binding protein CbpA